MSQVTCTRSETSTDSGMTNSSGRVFKSIAIGAFAGLAGAWAMNQFQALLSYVSKSGQQPQEEQSSDKSDDSTIKVAKVISREVFQHELRDDEKEWAGPAVHYGFGASVGAVYGALAETCPIATTGYGMSYGTAVWAVADEMAIPAFGLSKPIPETDLNSHARAWASHLVFGFVTDLVRRGALKLGL